MRFGLALALVLALQGSPCAANELMDAYRRALAHDPVLQAAQQQRAARIEVQPQALASLLPQVSAEGIALRQAERSPAADSSLTQTAYGTSRGYGLVLSQPVFDLQSINRWRESRLLASQAEVTLQAAQQRLILRVASAYFDVLSAADQLTAYRSQREAFARRLDQARTLEQTGIKARTDVEDAQAFYDRTAQNVIDAENALEDAKRVLAITTGEFPATFALIETSIPLEKPSPDNADAWAEVAGRDNFDLQAAALATQAAERDISVQKAGHWPTFAVEAAAGRTQRDGVFGNDLDDGSVALTFSWPLYAGGIIRSRVREAEAINKQTAAEYESLKRQIERATRAAFRGVATGVERVLAAKQSADSSARAVEASRRGVEFGTRTELDALNTQTNYFTSLRAYQQSRYDYLRAVLTLKQLAGRLSEADLIEIDRLLVATNANAENSHAL